MTKYYIISQEEMEKLKFNPVLVKDFEARQIQIYERDFNNSVIDAVLSKAKLVDLDKMAFEWWKATPRMKQAALELKFSQFIEEKIK